MKAQPLAQLLLFFVTFNENTRLHFSFLFFIYFISLYDNVLFEISHTGAIMHKAFPQRSFDEKEQVFPKTQSG